MVASSPARRSHNYLPSSPLSDILYADRNSETRHRQMLEAARREHERVHSDAVKVLEEYRKEEEARYIRKQKQKEEDRIRQEKELAAERKKLQELQAQKVEIPPEPPKPKLTPAKATPTTQPPAVTTQPAPVTSTPSHTSTFQTPVSSSTPSGPAAKLNPFAPAATSAPPSQQQPGAGAAASSPFETAQPAAKSPFAQVSTPTASSPFAPKPTQVQAAQLNGTTAAGVATPAQPLAKQAPPDRYQVIHQNLKDLRRLMQEQTTRNPALKNRMGDMRREIRKCVGQLTNGTGTSGNQPQVDSPPGSPSTSACKPSIRAVGALLREALENRMQSQLVDPSTIVLEPRQPVEGAVHNDVVPSLFLYLLNIFAKAALSQFVNEASTKPDAADPVGVTVAAVFSDANFHWRGKSLIDILIAKFRVVCPVLFGHNGSEKYEEGRRRLGWHKENGVWVPEQQHFDRMTGLGAGFAAISLRNFAKSKKTNPFPPTNYWTAMARIINTPPAEISNTQAIVLKAMIQHYEGKFLEAYGNAAREALQLALVEFPAKCPMKTPATQSLSVLLQTLQKESYFSLA